MTPARHICKNPSTAYSLTQMRNVICRSERMTLHWHRTAQLSLDSLTRLPDAWHKLCWKGTGFAQQPWCLNSKTSLNSGWIWAKGYYSENTTICNIFCTQNKTDKNGKIHNYFERIGENLFCAVTEVKEGTCVRVCTLPVRTCKNNDLSSVSHFGADWKASNK